MVLKTDEIVIFRLPSNVTPAPTPSTSPSISILLGVDNLFATSTLNPKDGLTHSGAAALPLDFNNHPVSPGVINAVAFAPVWYGIWYALPPFKLVAIPALSA